MQTMTLPILLLRNSVRRTSEMPVFKVSKTAIAGDYEALRRPQTTRWISSEKDHEFITKRGSGTAQAVRRSGLERHVKMVRNEDLL